MEQIQCCVSCESIPLELDRLSVNFHSILGRPWIYYEPSNLAIPFLYRMMRFLSLSKTKRRVRINVCTFAFDSLGALSCSKVVLITGVVFRSIADIPFISLL